MPKNKVKSYSPRWENKDFEAVKNYWKTVTGLVLLDFCVAINCIEKKVSFVHVRKLNSDDQTDFITPLCHKHGALGQECEVYDCYIAPVSKDTDISNL